MALVQCRDAGRVFLLCPRGPLGLPDDSPERLVERARSRGSRAILLDMTHTPYIDSDGLRWLIRLRRAAAADESSPQLLRIVARRDGSVWRNLKLLDTGITLFASLRDAWRAPLGWPARRDAPPVNK